MMKAFITTLLLASAAIVGAQITSLPPCGVTCGIEAANATSCSVDINCTCQYANQAIISPILRACLAKNCTSNAQSSAAITAGENICKTVSQTASSMPPSTLTSSMLSMSMLSSSMASMSMLSSSTKSHSSSATPTASSTRSAHSTAARSSSVTPSATRSASASPASTSAAASAAAAAAARPTAVVEALVAVAGMAILAL